MTHPLAEQLATLLAQGVEQPRHRIDAAQELRRQHAEIERLTALTLCGCGDEFSPDDPGTCGNCKAGEVASLHVEIERLMTRCSRYKARFRRLIVDRDAAIRSRIDAQSRLADALGDVARLEPMRKRAEDIERLTVERDAMRAELAALTEDLRTVAHSGMGSCAPVPAVPAWWTPLLEIAGEIDKRFQSMNAVPIDKASVPASEWKALVTLLLAAAPKGGE